MAATRSMPTSSGSDRRSISPSVNSATRVPAVSVRSPPGQLGDR